MKVKTDFVTNSSSVCYVLASTVSGILPRLSGGYYKLEEFYTDTKHKFLYEGYGHITIEADQDVLGETDDPVYDIDLVINDGHYYDENDDDKAVTFFELKLRLHNPHDFDIADIVKETVERILFKELKETIRPSQLTYFAFPSKIFGDGWDGGDPQGPSYEYIYRHDVYKAETKMGILNLINSTVIPEVRSIEQPLNLNEILLDNMNKEGFCLEEQNDKNS